MKLRILLFLLLGLASLKNNCIAQEKSFDIKRLQTELREMHLPAIALPQYDGFRANTYKLVIQYPAENFEVDPHFEPFKFELRGWKSVDENEDIQIRLVMSNFDIQEEGIESEKVSFEKEGMDTIEVSVQNDLDNREMYYYNLLMESGQSHMEIADKKGNILYATDLSPFEYLYRGAGFETEYEVVSWYESNKENLINDLRGYFYNDQIEKSDSIAEELLGIYRQMINISLYQIATKEDSLYEEYNMAVDSVQKVFENYGNYDEYEDMESDLMDYINYFEVFLKDDLKTEREKKLAYISARNLSVINSQLENFTEVLENINFWQSTGIAENAAKYYKGIILNHIYRFKLYDLGS